MEDVPQLVNEVLRAIEEHRKARLSAGEDRADVDLESSALSLSLIAGLLEEQGIETAAIHRVLVDLTALSNGSSPSGMLTPRPTRHRRPVAPSVEGFKGRLAAIMEHLQGRGLTRKEAADRVVRYTPDNLKRKLGLNSPNTVEGWKVQWGGERGSEKGHGREGYELMRAILQVTSPTEDKLSGILKALDRALPG